MQFMIYRELTEVPTANAERNRGTIDRIQLFSRYSYIGVYLSSIRALQEGQNCARILETHFEECYAKPHLIQGALLRYMGS